MSIITDSQYIKDKCQPGEKKCCSYFAVGSNGFECLKESSLKSEIDKRREASTMNAMGDNCTGYLMETSTEKIHVGPEDGNWANKLCKCSECGIIEKCTITFDFYTNKDRPGFQCEACMIKELSKA